MTLILEAPSTDQRRLARALGLALEACNIEPKGHTDRVATLAVSVAAELGFEDEEIGNIELGAYLHDLGKLGIDRTIWHKTISLSESDWAIVKAHTRHGYEFVESLHLPQMALDVMQYHHEHWDGSGYPYGLRQLEIPIAARLFAVIDAFVAMTASGSQRRTINNVAALYELYASRGIYETRMIDALARVLKISVPPTPDFKQHRHLHQQPAQISSLPSSTRMLLLNERSQVMFATPAMHQAMSLGSQTLLDVLDIVHPEDRDALTQTIHTARAQFGSPNIVPLRFCKGSDWQTWFLEAHLLPDFAAESGLVVLVFEPSMPAFLLPNQSPISLLGRMIEYSSVLILLTDHNQQIVDASPALLKYTGYELAEVLGRTPRMFQGAHSSRAALEVLRHGIEHGIPCQTEVINYGKNGQEYLMQINIDPIRDGNGEISHFLAVQHDISAQRQGWVEGQRLLETTQDAIIITDLRGKALQANLVAGEMLGFDPLHLPRDPIYFLLPESNRIRMREFIEQMFLLAQPAHLEIQVAPKQQWQRIMTWSVTPFIPDGRLYWVGVDITEQSQTNTTLRESEARYRNVVESINDAILQIDGNARIIYSNPAWNRLSGFTPVFTSRIKSALRFIHPSHRLITRQSLMTALRLRQSSVRLEFPIINRNNRLRWVLAAIHFTYLEQRFTGASAVLSDVSSRKEANIWHHLSHSAQKFYSSKDLLLALNALVEFIGANDAQILSSDLSLATKTVSDFEPDHDNEGVISLRLTENAELLVRFTTGTHLVESTTLLEFRSAFASAFERALAYNSLVESEAQSRQFIEVTLRAQEQERERIAMDLHDGPAQTMVSALRFIESSLEQKTASDPQLQKQLGRSLELLVKAVGQVRETISDLIPPDLEILGLRDVLAQRLEQMAIENGWQSRLEFDAVRLLPETQVTLYRIVIEALNNARKHAKASRIVLHLTQTPEGAVLEIGDNGIGFDTTQRKTKSGGYGIGQIAMQRRAELIDCRCEIISQLGAGTTVRVSIPESQFQRTP